MAILPIIKAPDPVLKRRCVPVETIDGTIQRLMDDMLETMYAAPGVGLAAPQVAVHKRIIVADVSDPAGDKREPLQMANPEIIEATCFQHEMDHLDGILFVDYLSALKRNIILRKMSKLKRAEATAGV